MTTKSLQAWLIHKQHSGESSLKPCFFTSELGLVHCLYKGGRAPKKQAVLQAFTPLWIHLEERHNYYYLKAVENETPPLLLSGINLFSALYLNELIYILLKPFMVESKLFEAYTVTLYHLASVENKVDIEPLLRRFEWSLLEACGHSFSLNYDVMGQKIKAENKYQFISGNGFLANTTGLPGSHLLALASDDLSEHAYRKTAKLIMRQAIDYLLEGREIKTRLLFR